MTAARFVHCKCGHAKERHEVPGFDGECVADACKCRAYRPNTVEPAPVTSPPALRIVPTTKAAPTPATSFGGGGGGGVVPVEQGGTFERLVAAGKASAVKRTAALAAKIEGQLLDLHARIVDERQADKRAKQIAAEREAARREVATLEKELAEAKARLRGKPAPPATKPAAIATPPGDGTCPECGQGNLKNVGAHRYRAHGYKAG